MQLHNIIIPAILTWSASAAVIDSSPNNMNLKRADDLECDYDHAPNRDDCAVLKNRIATGQFQKSLESKPREIRYNSCYVSWSDYVVGTAQDLVPYIGRIQTVCQSNINRSGIIKNVNILGQQKKCAVCLSNRGSGCSN
ncbi:hypothetical protein V8F06_004779 [Rhypophila decipiens]